MGGSRVASLPALPEEIADDLKRAIHHKVRHELERRITEARRHKGRTRSDQVNLRERPELAGCVGIRRIACARCRTVNEIICRRRDDCAYDGYGPDRGQFHGSAYLLDGFEIIALVIVGWFHRILFSVTGGMI
jgi:hypothetical protein